VANAKSAADPADPTKKSAADPADPTKSSASPPMRATTDARSPRTSLGRVRDHLLVPVPATSLAIWRIAFGLLLAGNVLRYWQAGWIHDLFVAPRVMFPHWGFAWLPRPEPTGVAILFGAVFVGGLAIAHGRHLRLAAAFTFVPFTWLELLDRSTYLNHYYLVSLVLALLAVLPSASCGEAPHERAVPRVTLFALRAQVGLVYFFAGVAKLRADWLFEAEPLTTWLARHTDAPLVGPLLDDRWVAFAASWAGMLFDLSVVFLLLARRTRRFAFAVVVLFHLATAALFTLGLFPWLMMVNATLFFAPDWPSRVRDTIAKRRARASDAPSGSDLASESVVPSGARAPEGPRSNRVRLVVPLLGILAAHFALQLALPFRQHLYAGDPLWHEQGFRFSWCVMLIEKTATLDLRVVDAEGRETIVHPREELTPLQLRMVPTQPDLVLAYAHHVRDRFEADGHGEVQVYADGFASLHGRPRQRLVNPEVDLARERDGLLDKPWIVPLRSPDTGRRQIAPDVELHDPTRESGSRSRQTGAHHPPVASIHATSAPTTAIPNERPAARSALLSASSEVTRASAAAGGRAPAARP
jgi:hypothetical protein